jgi:hypothetical protein
VVTSQEGSVLGFNSSQSCKPRLGPLVERVRSLLWQSKFSVDEAREPAERVSPAKAQRGRHHEDPSIIDRREATGLAWRMKRCACSAVILGLGYTRTAPYGRTMTRLTQLNPVKPSRREKIVKDPPTVDHDPKCTSSLVFFSPFSKFEEFFLAHKVV